MLGSCAFFSKTWIEVSGSSAKDVSPYCCLSGGNSFVFKATLRQNAALLCRTGGEAAEGAADGDEGTQRDFHGS